VVAHPDDEVLGCGGTIGWHVQRGHSVHVVFVADGVHSRRGQGPAIEEALADRRRAGEKAASILGASLPVYLDFPDQQLDTVPFLEIVQAIERLTNALEPDLVYTHFADDLNMDHRIVAQAVLTALRPLPGRSTRAVYGCEVLSSTEWGFLGRSQAFRPTRFVDISGHMTLKMDALRAYDAEMRAFPHARSYECVEALARFRGGSVGVPAAEAFVLYREIAV
jgi:LmbE family N-acetylglucosaminyl deacetylase